MVSTYSRPHLPFADQLALLEGRGLTVADRPAAIDWLRKLGYYRLSAYWYPFRQRQVVQTGPNQLTSHVLDTFVAGSTFEAAVALYRFDKRLRSLLMDAIEHIEVAARVDIAHYLGAKHTFAQEEASILDGKFVAAGQGGAASKHNNWLSKLADCTDRSKEEFVNHYKTKYGTPLPIWVSIEVWDFGLISWFFPGMQFKDREAMANRFGVPRPDVFATWLRTLNYLRNMAAHHSRVWNRNIIDQPRLPKPNEMTPFDPLVTNPEVERLYASLCIVAYLLERACPGSDWPAAVAAHLEAFPTPPAPHITLAALGCPAGWRGHAFWPKP